jgi:mono/diheme cytochrome c family protein
MKRQHLHLHLSAIALSSLSVALGCQNDAKTSMAASSAPDPAPDPKSMVSPAQAGKKLFDKLGCLGCHTVSGKGGSVGPDLTHEAGRGRSGTWLTEQIRDSRTHYANSVMPAYSSLSDQQVQQLVAYLDTLSAHPASGSGQQSRAGEAAPSAPAAGEAGTTESATAGSATGQTTTAPSPAPEGPSIAEGGRLWRLNCGRCHNYRNPSEFNAAQWSVIVHHMALRVPLARHEEVAILKFLTTH